MKELDRLLQVIEEIAAGRYSNDVMALTRPEVQEPVRSIAEAMGLMMVKVEAREYHLELLIQELRELNGQIRRNAVGTVSAMASALAARDKYTEGHAERVGAIAGLIAEEMGLTGEEVELIRVAGRLHDIGKIGFSDRLFLPHDKKNPDDVVREITRHPQTGSDILKDLDFLGDALSYIRCHHERPDGRGYPRHLTDPDIPLGAKVIAVADGYDAMTTDRPYQKGKTPEEALAVLKKFSGSKWDPACVSAFEKAMPRLPADSGSSVSAQAGIP
ncbi:MAG TPA: HD domain-containing protein [Geobacteraceae bacterium]|nr:HD domain-containing protein [Geobacteraceae bacterium]